MRSPASGATRGLNTRVSLRPRLLNRVAGNTPVRPFDNDLKAPKLAPQKLRFDFQLR